MPTIRQITLPDGVTYDLAATAINREVVPIVTECFGSETTFNALEVTEDSLGRTFFNINNPIGNPILQWIYDGSSEVLGINGAVSIGGLLNAYGGAQFNNGGLYFDNATALPQQTAANSYNVVVFDAFASGGRAKYQTATSSNTASTIVSRNSNGDFTARYINATYFNQSSGAENPASYTSYAAFFSSDGFLRKSTKSNMRAWLGLLETGITTLNSTYGCQYERRNGLVTVKVDYRSNVTANVNIGTLPTGHRPPFVVMAASATGGANTSYVQITATGVVTLAKVGSGGWCIATITFPAT